MTFRDAQAEAFRRCGMSKGQIKAAFAFADVNCPNSEINEPLQLKPGVTEDAFIEILADMQRKLMADRDAMIDAKEWLLQAQVKKSRLN